MQGVDGHQAGAGRAQSLEILLVVELEGRVAEHADGYLVRADAHRPGLRGQRQHRSHGRAGGVQVHMGLDRGGQRGHRLVRGRVFLVRGHAQVAHGEDVPVQPRHDAQHRQVGVALHRLADNGFVPGRGDLVEDHAGETQARVECLAAEHQRGHGAGGLGAVDHQEHRQVEQQSQFRGGVLARHAHPVVEAAIALDHGKGAVLQVRLEGGDHGLGRHQVGIEVVAGPARSLAQPAGVDVVRPLLERDHAAPPFGQGADQAHRDHGLARPAAQAGEHHALHCFLLHEPFPVQAEPRLPINF